MLKGDRYLRVRGDKEIWRFDAELARRNPDFEVITEREAFPERFAGEQVAERIVEHRAAQVEQVEPKVNVDMSVAEDALTPPSASPELIADASRGFGRGVLPGVEGSAAPAKTIVSTVVAGLEGI